MERRKTISAKELEKVVKNRLTERDRRILDILARHRMATLPQLAELAGMHPVQGKATLARRMKFLYDFRFVDKAKAFVGPDPAKPVEVYSLDVSYRAVADGRTWKRCIRHVRMTDGSYTRRLPITFLHTLSVNDAVCVAKREASKCGWKAQHLGVEEENFMRISFGKKSGLIPDVVAVLVDEKSQSLFSMFVEVDLGNEGKELVKSKVKHYFAAKMCRAWIGTPWYEKHVRPRSPAFYVFPHTVFLLGNSNPSRKSMIERTMEHFGLKGTVLSFPEFGPWLRSHMC